MTDSVNSSAGRMMELIRAELVNIPVEHWGFFFPCHVAVWRFIQVMRPGALPEISARFERQPVFRGTGSVWFCETLGSRDDYIDQLESIMYPITKEAPPKVRDAVLGRGFFHEEELPPINRVAVERLVTIVLSAVDDAIASGAIHRTS